MFWAVFRVEGLSLVRDRAVWAVLLGFALVVVYAALSGGALAQAERRAHSELLTEERARFAALQDELVAIERGGPVRHLTDPRDPHIVGRELGRRVATLPPGPLAAVSVGQRDLLPTAIIVTTEARLGDSGADDAAGLARRVTGAFDLAFVLVFLLPLVVIALSFDVLSAERERGTLALVLAQPIRLGTFVLAKTALRAAVLLVVVLAAGIVAPLVAGGGLSGADVGANVLGYAGLLVGYTAFWFCLAVLVNAFGSSSSGNALSLVGVWLLLVVVVPGLTSVVVDTLHPAPSRVELVNRARDAAREAEAEVSELEGDHGAAPASADRDVARRAVHVQGQLESRVEPVIAAFHAQLARQQALVDRLRFLSPAIVAFEGMSDVSGSGVTRHQQFSAAVSELHAEHKRFFFARIEQGARLTSADYERMPRFERREPPPSALLWRVGSGLLGLLVPAGLMVVLSLRGFRGLLSRGLR
ncbi:MAG: ABC transporter permease subunit [Polyangiaceae bacterium]|nr:ABC transporter permease subunit [Polyangiaceae bacterium]